MGALVAVLQTDDSLLRCQLERLKSHVSLQGEGATPALAYGFGYYAAGNVLLGKRPSGATSPLSLPEVVGKVDSEALLVHARHTPGLPSKDENTQPFRYRRWLFAHAGTIAGWEAIRPRLLAALPDHLRRQIAGETPAEHAFMLFVKQLKDEGRLEDLDLDAATAGRALAKTVRQLEAWARDASEQKQSPLVFVATNGRIMAATRRGGPLFYALYEGIVPCALDELAVDTPESDPRVRPHRRVKAVAFATRLRASNGFIEVPEGSVVAVNRSLQVTVSSLNGP
ncbi:class II glutamine amidotransferase [Anaeromyxobacter sp. Fw109-5]|uniref:class II glutamine amidotransferase n=1 Tax=Anaeromyxobacter sp. (strain Fw109-5) TaxID=404589 RepID=UPI0000ED8159|nr:class II glutamine amidotransferase [Anaeromyxobacter sp. Fw109-5]ABS25479.1 glutamine amidotransferase, class-II [Anaeromyxobacter sp. Fw109-5]